MGAREGGLYTPGFAVATAVEFVDLLREFGNRSFNLGPWNDLAN